MTPDGMSYADASALSTGLLIGRLVVGLGIAAHGSQKLFGWFGGMGRSGTGSYFESIGYEPGWVFALAAGVGELTAGLLVATGLLGPVGPGLMLAVMLVAAIQQRHNGFFAQNNGLELPLLYAAAGVALAFTGYGRYALDAVFGLEHLSTIPVETIALAAGAMGGAATVALRRHRPSPR